MDYKSINFENHQDPFFEYKSIYPDPFPVDQIIEDDEFEIDPKLFFEIEKGLAPNNSIENIYRILDEFIIASKILSNQYINTFGQTKVPFQLVELLKFPDKTISYYSSQIIYSLINPKAPEYADDLCDNGFLLQCAYILNQKTNDSQILYMLLISLSNLANFSVEKCDLILRHIKVGILNFYAQSKILDEGCYNELLRLLVILSYNIKGINIEFSSQLIELTQSIFSDLITASKLKRYRILQLSYIFSQNPQFYEMLKYDHSSIKLLKLFASNKKSKKEICLLIPILTNNLYFIDDNFENELAEVCNLISIINENEILSDDDYRIIGLSCKYIQIYLEKNSNINEFMANKTASILIEFLDKKYAFTWKRKVLFCVFDLLLYISDDTLFDLIYHNSLFETIVDALESEDNELVRSALKMMISLFQKYGKTNDFTEIIKEFTNENGIDSLIELRSVISNNDVTKQIYEMSEMLLNKYFE